MLNDKKIAFIGGGNMAQSLIGGLLNAGVDAAQITVADPDAAQRERVRKTHGVVAEDDNAAAVEGADVVILAVKPQVMHTAVAPLGVCFQARRPLLISIAAGVTVSALEHWLGARLPIVRTIPNTPALIGSGAAALFAGPGVSAEQRATAETILGAVGSTRWVAEESLMDAATAVSGSGPAYFFLMIELIETAARELGLDAETAHALTVQTALGAARMAKESGASAAELRRRVTSPGGTTAAALAVFEQEGLGRLVTDALRAARSRSGELAEQFGVQGE
jgi:pyrroline-5-carboxylate reductase